MSDVVLTALISGGVTLVGTIIAVFAANSKTLYRIEQLEKKQDKYNNLQERTLTNENNIKHIYYEIEEIKNDKSR